LCWNCVEIPKQFTFIKNVYLIFVSFKSTFRRLYITEVGRRDGKRCATFRY
jgi:hypothetical protein